MGIRGVGGGGRGVRETAGTRDKMGLKMLGHFVPRCKDRSNTVISTQTITTYMSVRGRRKMRAREGRRSTNGARPVGRSTLLCYVLVGEV